MGRERVSCFFFFGFLRSAVLSTLMTKSHFGQERQQLKSRAMYTRLAKSITSNGVQLDADDLLLLGSNQDSRSRLQIDEDCLHEAENGGRQIPKKVSQCFK